MDSLPVELIRMVLFNLSDLATLSAIVHASPRFHSTYLSTREELLTLVTLRELELHNIIIEQPSNGDFHVLRITSKPTFSSTESELEFLSLISATKICFDQRAANQKAKFSVDLCVSLHMHKKRGVKQFLFGKEDGFMFSQGELGLLRAQSITYAAPAVAGRTT